MLGHCPLIDYPRSNGRAARLSGQIHKRYFTPSDDTEALTRVSKLGIRSFSKLSQTRPDHVDHPYINDHEGGCMMRIMVFIATQHKCMAVATEVANTRYDLYHSCTLTAHCNALWQCGVNWRGLTRT